MCHEPTSVGLAASIGVGKGTVLLEDFEKCDLVICVGITTVQTTLAC